MNPEEKSRINDTQLEASQGLVRERLASLRNLEHLLKSPKTGPKALIRIVSETRRCMEPPGSALNAYLELVGKRSADVDVSGLLAFVKVCATFIEEAFSEAETSKMGAKARLSLEGKIVRLVSDVNALRDLIDLLDASATANATELQVNALVVETLAKCAPGKPQRSNVVHVFWERTAEDATVYADARVMMPWMATAFGLTAGKGVRALRVNTSVGSDGEVLFRCEHCAPGLGDSVPCIFPRVVAPTLGVLRNAASLCGITFGVDENAQSVDFVIPPERASNGAN